jgi:hypothetical protein
MKAQSTAPPFHRIPERHKHIKNRQTRSAESQKALLHLVPTSRLRSPPWPSTCTIHLLGPTKDKLQHHHLLGRHCLAGMPLSSADAWVRSGAAVYWGRPGSLVHGELAAALLRGNMTSSLVWGRVAPPWHSRWRWLLLAPWAREAESARQRG